MQKEQKIFQELSRFPDFHKIDANSIKYCPGQFPDIFCRTNGGEDLFFELTQAVDPRAEQFVQDSLKSRGNLYTVGWIENQFKERLTIKCSKIYRVNYPIELVIYSCRGVSQPCFEHAEYTKDEVRHVIDGKLSPFRRIWLIHLLDSRNISLWVYPSLGQCKMPS